MSGYFVQNLDFIAQVSSQHNVMAELEHYRDHLSSYLAENQECIW